MLVLFAVAIAVVLAMAFSNAQSTSTGIANNAEYHTRARAIAETGLNMAINHVQYASDWRDSQSNGTWITDHGFDGGTFTLVGEDGEDTDGDGVVDGDGDLADDADDPVTLTATGTYRGVTHKTRAVVYPGMVYISRIAASYEVKVKDDGVIDSYRSADGAYGGSNVGAEALVSTNSTSSDKIKVESYAVINGDAYAGPGGDPNEVISVSSSGEITGVQDVLDEAISIPIPVMPSLGASVGDVQYTNGFNVLSSDLHCDKLTIKNTAVLEISGTVHIQCEDEFKIEDTAEVQLQPGAKLYLYTMAKVKVRDEAKINANTADPSRVLAMHFASDHFDLEDWSETYATVIAPWGLLHVKKDSQFFGTFAGRKVEVKERAQLHHDLSSGFPPYFEGAMDTTLAVSDKIELTNDVVLDSFDSRLGPYDQPSGEEEEEEEEECEDDEGGGCGGNVGADASIATNKTDSDKIRMKDNAVLNGAAYAGPGGNPADVIKLEGSAQITGDQASLASAINIPTTSAPTDIPQQNDYELSTGTVTLSNDVNHKKFILKGDAVLEIDGDVRIYARDDFIVMDTAQIRLIGSSTLEIYGEDTIKFEIDAQVNINTGDPMRLTLYNVGSHKIELRDNAQFCGTIVSPDGEFNPRDNTHFYGSFKGEKVKAEQSAQLHLDVAGVQEQDSEAGSAGEAVVRWVEMN